MLFLLSHLTTWGKKSLIHEPNEVPPFPHLSLPLSSPEGQFPSVSPLHHAHAPVIVLGPSNHDHLLTCPSLCLEGKLPKSRDRSSFSWYIHQHNTVPDTQDKSLPQNRSWTTTACWLFVNKVLLDHNHTHLFIYCLLSCYN